MSLRSHLVTSGALLILLFPILFSGCASQETTAPSVFARESATYDLVAKRDGVHVATFEVDLQVRATVIALKVTVLEAAYPSLNKTPILITYDRISGRTLSMQGANALYPYGALAIMPTVYDAEELATQPRRNSASLASVGNLLGPQLGHRAGLPVSTWGEAAVRTEAVSDGRWFNITAQCGIGSHCWGSSPPHIWQSDLRMGQQGLLPEEANLAHVGGAYGMSLMAVNHSFEAPIAWTANPPSLTSREVPDGAAAPPCGLIPCAQETQTHLRFQRGFTFLTSTPQWAEWSKNKEPVLYDVLESARGFELVGVLNMPLGPRENQTGFIFEDRLSGASHFFVIGYTILADGREIPFLLKSEDKEQYPGIGPTQPLPALLSPTGNLYTKLLATTNVQPGQFTAFKVQNHSGLANIDANAALMACIWVYEYVEATNHLTFKAESCASPRTGQLLWTNRY